jgi:beta-phosphoglucomutase-like phosphatase (HAD superfamily)
MTPDPAALDAAIRQASHLLFAFDGPIRRTDTGSPLDSETPTAPYIYEAFAACRESGRSVAVISPKTEVDVPNYLSVHDLFEPVTVIAISIADAINFLELTPADCLLIASSTTDIQVAEATGVPSIGYSRIAGDAASLVDAGAATFVYSLADVALKLRALFLDQN